METWFEDELSQLLPTLHCYARKLTRRHTGWADDLVQDTVEQALLGAHRFQQGTDMRSWLKTIMRHTFFRHLELAGRDQRNVSLDDETCSPELMPSVQADLSGLLLEDAARLLAILPANQREAIMLTCVLGLSVEAAAERLQVSTGTIKSRVNRGRFRMAKAQEADALPPRSFIRSP